MGEVTAEPWRDPAAPLEKLTELLDVSSYETPDAWKCYGEFDPAHLGSDDSFAAFAALVPALRGRYGDAVVLRVRAGDAIKLQLDATYPTPSLDELRKAVAGDLPLTLDATVDKSLVAAQWNLTDDRVATRLYFSSQALAKALSRSLTELDTGRNALFDDATKKLVILVPAHDIELDGTRLAILGGKATASWRNAIPAEPLPQPLSPQWVQEQLHWIGVRLETLTPQHLAVEPKRVEDADAIASALYAHLFVCSLLFLARQSTQQTFTFNSERQETDVDIGAAPALKTKEAWRSALALAQLAQWTYETPNEADDRLIIVQHVMVDALQNHSTQENGTEILRLAADLYERAKWGWESYLNGELKKYLSQEKELEETVEKTTRDFGDQVQALTKGVTDSMLAAVAVIVGSFLVAVFKTPFQDVVFQAALSVYALYLFVFPICFGLRTTWERFEKSRDTFAARRKKFEERLTKDPVKKIVEPLVPDSEWWFKKWYWLTVAAYFAVFAILLAAIVYVPPEIRQWTDDFTLTSASADGNQQVVIRGRNFDKDKAIVVTHGRTTFTNVTTPPTLFVHATALTFTADKSDLPIREVKVSQGTVGPKTIALR